MSRESEDTIARSGNGGAGELASSMRTVEVLRSVAGATSHSGDEVAVEAPVALVFNGISHAVMMATPDDLEALGLGFALSEGLIGSPSECYGIDVQSHSRGCEVQMEISSRAAAQLKTRRRAMEGRTGCGLCGIESLQQLDLVPPRRPEPVARVDGPAPLLRAFAALPARQRLNAQTGAVHAAGWADLAGNLLDVAEDVGRHNALDKLLGRLALDGRLGEAGFVVMSSRASYELVRKCAQLGIATLATISAPTSLAIDVATGAGVELYGFCRGERAVCYVAAPQV